MGFYTRGPYKINKVFLETLAGAYEVSEVFFETLTGICEISEVFLETLTGVYEVNEVFLETFTGVYEVSEVFFETLTPFLMILHHMIGCHREGERGVFNSFLIVILFLFFEIVGPTIY